MFKRRKHNRKRESAAKRFAKASSVLMTISGTALVVVCVVMAGRWLADTNNFPISKVNVEGGFAQVSPEQVREAVMPIVGSGFFQLDIETIQSSLKGLPWVDAVVVRKVWPDTLFVRVKEQVAMARWGEKGLLNKRGEAFYPSPNTIDRALPLLAGPKGSEKIVADRFKTASAVLHELDTSLTRLHYTARGAWQFELNGGQTIMLGRENVSQRIHRLAVFYDELKQSKAEASLMTVDMRYDTGIAVYWQDNHLENSCENLEDCQHAVLDNNERELIF